MPPSVLGQVITSHESPVTHGTHKFLLTSMRASVSGEFIRARKFLITTFPVTAEGFLTCQNKEEHIMSESVNTDDLISLP